MYTTVTQTAKFLFTAHVSRKSVNCQVFDKDTYTNGIGNMFRPCVVELHLQYGFQQNLIVLTYVVSTCHLAPNIVV